jgi:hypothetical protein
VCTANLVVRVANLVVRAADLVVRAADLVVGAERGDRGSTIPTRSHA